MTLKTFYPKLLWNTLMKRCWYGAASFLVLFLAMPLTAMLRFQEAEELAQRVLERLLNEKQAFVEFISGANIFVAVLVIGLALLGAWSGLAWLHSRKQMDLYGSLPVKREVLYGMECATAVLWFLFSYIVNLVLAWLVAISKGIFTGEAIRLGIYSIGVFLLAFLAIYFCAAVAMMLTGKVLTGILGTLVFLGIAPVTVVLLVAFPDLFFISYVSTSGVWEDIAMYLSPVVVFLNMFAHIGRYLSLDKVKNYIELVPTIVMLIWIVAGAAISVILLRIRPSEGAEQSMVFPKTEGPIKGGILYPIALGGGLFFWGIRGDYGEYGWMWFGLLFVSFVISILIEIIYHHDRKRIFKHKLSTGISVGAAIVTILVFRYDIFGIDTWIPKENKVESMILFHDYTYAWFEYPDGSDSSEEYLRKNMDQTRGDYIYDYLVEGRELLEIYRDARYGDMEAEAYLDEHGWGEDVTVVFRMKNGTISERRYRISEESMESIRKQMFEEKLYKEAWFPILLAKDDEYQINNFEFEDEAIDFSNWSVRENKQFVNIYKEELQTLSYEQIFEETMSYVDFFDDKGKWIGGSCPFNKNFVKSIAYIEEMERKHAESDMT